MKNVIKKIVFEEFSKLINNIEMDFRTNYIKKKNNFLLNQLDTNMVANMVFVSSFESKSGFAIETCAKRIAMLKFGKENVPSLINPRGLKHGMDIDKLKGQSIITDVDIENGEFRGGIATFRATNVAKGSGKAKIECGVNQESKKELLLLAERYVGKNLHTKPVDLAFFDGENWNLCELKAGGDLDSSNAPSNIEKLLTIYAGVNIPNANIFFATLYNKNGEGNTWTGAVKKHLKYPEMFLVGKNFWEKILPEGISFDEFTGIYKSALEDIDLNKRINKMIEECLEKK